MEQAHVILATLVAYKALLVLIGLLMRGRMRDGVDFFLAGRGLGPLVAAISASASSSSVWTLLGVAGAAYAWGLSALWIFPACVGGFVLNWYVLAPRLQGHSRAEGSLTLTEVLAGPPGTPGRGAVVAVASGIVLVSMAAYVAAQFQGAGKAFQENFDLDAATSILIGAGVVMLYTWLGGFWAVSVTDTLQGLLMAAAAVVIPLAVLVAVGGPAGLVAGVAAVEQEGYLGLTRHAPQAGGFGFVLGILGIGLGYPGQPHVVNRFMALREGREAVLWARRFAVAWAVLVYSGMLLLGMGGRVLFPGLADREVVFFTAASELLPPVAAGMMTAAVLSAIMSTADSQLLVAASSATHDLRLGARLRLSLLQRSRAVVLALSAGAVVMALAGTQQIFDRVLIAWTAMGAAFGPLLVFLLWRGRVGPRGTVAAMLTGFLLAVAAHLYEPTRGGIVERIVPYAAALGVILLSAALEPTSPRRPADPARPARR